MLFSLSKLRVLKTYAWWGQEVRLLRPWAIFRITEGSKGFQAPDERVVLVTSVPLVLSVRWLLRRFC